MTEEKPKKLCPKGHPSGTRTGGGVCGVRRCGAESAALTGSKKLDLDELEKVAPEDQAFQTRAQLAQLPKNLKGDEAVEWAQKKLVDLLPEAVASLAYDLRYGSDKTRSEAADKVLRANGLDKREAQQGGGGLIVLNFGSEVSGKVPWLERMQPAKKVE